MNSSTCTLAVLVGLFLPTLVAVAAPGDSSEPVPADACVLELVLPEGSAITVDDTAYGTRRRLQFSGLSPGQYYVAQLRVQFPSGKVDERRLLLSAGRRLRLPLADPHSQRPELVVQTGRFFELAEVLSADGRYLAFASNDGTAELWETEHGRRLRRYDTGVMSVSSVDLSPDNRLLATPGLKSVTLWDAATGQILREIPVAPVTTAPAGSGEGADFVAQRFSPDSRFLATCATASQPQYDMEHRHVEVATWNVQTGERVRTWPIPDTSASYGTLAWSSDGSHLAVSLSRIWRNPPAEVHVWNLLSGAKRPVVKPDHIGCRVAISADGELLAMYTGKGGPVLWNLDDAREVRRFATPQHPQSLSQVWGLAFSPDGSRLLAGCTFGEADKDNHLLEACMWDVQTGRQLATYGPLQHQNVLDFLAGGTSLAAGRTVYDASSRRPLREIQGLESQWEQQPYGATCVSFSGDGQLILFGNVCWDVASGKPRYALDGWDATLSPDGRYVATIVRRRQPTGKKEQTEKPNPEIILWEAATGRKITSLPVGSASTVRAVAFSPDGHSLAAGLDDGTVPLWDLANLEKTTTIQLRGGSDDAKPQASWLAFSPDSRKLVLGLPWQYFGLWWSKQDVDIRDAANGQRLLVLPGTREHHTAQFLADNQSLLTAEQGNLFRWDLRQGSQVWKIRAHSTGVHWLAPSPDGRLVVTTSRDNTAKIWDAQTGAELCTLRGHASWVGHAAFSPDGQRLLTGSNDGTARLWDVATGAELVRMVNVGDEGQWLATTPDGLFDGSAEGRRLVTYRVGKGLTVVPVERFFQDFYRPGLLASLCRDEHLQASVQFASQRAPHVRIVAPAEGTLVESPQVTLQVEVTDEGGGIKGPWLMHNGARLLASGKSQREDNLLRHSFVVPLIAGDNRLEVRAASEDGSWESEPAVLVLHYQAPPARPALHLLAVGINHYAQQTMNLKFAADDARTVAHVFQQRGPALYGEGKVHVAQLLDQQATRPGIKRALSLVADSARPHDTFVLFLAGHGTMLGQRYYFIPHEFRQHAEKLDDDIRQQGLPGDEIDDAVQAIAALKRVLIYDTCQSGGTIALGRTARDPFAFRGALERMSRATGSFTIAATAATAAAHEVDQLKHGVLTYALLAALGDVSEGPLAGQSLRAQQPVVEVRDWFSFAQDRVPLLTRLFLGEEQWVGFSGQGVSFPLLPCAK